MLSKVYIIGMGVEGKESLSSKAIKLVESASLLIGGERHLEEFPEFKGERFVLKANLKEMLEVILKNNAPAFGTPSLLKRGLGGVAVLASGDPGLFGIADYLIRNLGRDKVEIIPNVSAMQWAFAKAKVSWNDARIVSSHGRGMEKVLEAAREAEKIGIFTSNGDEPSEIAKLLIDNGLTDFTAYICEDLGMETEKVSEMPVSEVIGKSFAALNVMVLVRQGSGLRGKGLEGNSNRTPYSLSLTPLIGIPDSEFAHSKGLITKEEVRAVSLAKLGLRDDSVVWDIGAGSGSVGIEAARLARNGKVFAIEKEPERIANIRENVEKFGVKNLEVFEGKAPNGIESFADPDSVFIGGSGGNLSDILDFVKARLRPSGRIVINAITLETLHEATTGLKERGFDVDVVSLNIARSKDLIGMKMFEAENPVFIIVGRRGDPCDRPI